MVVNNPYWTLSFIIIGPVDKEKEETQQIPEIITFHLGLKEIFKCAQIIILKNPKGRAQKKFNLRQLDPSLIMSSYFILGLKGC